MPKSFKATHSKGIEKAFARIVKAYENYETSVKCESEYVDDLFYNIQFIYPPFDTDTEYSMDTDYDSKKQVLKWKYTDSKEEHDKNLAAFKSSIEEWFNSCTSKEDPEKVKAIAVYMNFCHQINYDFDAIKVMESRAEGERAVPDVSVYHALMEKKGICTSFAGGYAYLLLQLGVDATMMGGTGMIDGKSQGHAWTVFTYDGKSYVADPTMDRHHSEGKGLLYFGTNNKERAKVGFKEKDIISDVMGIPNDYYKVNGTGFDCFRGMKEVTIDRDKKVFHCKDEKGNTSDIPW